MSGDGIKNIEIRETSSGGFEIIDSGKGVVSLKKKDWYVIFDGKKSSNQSRTIIVFV